MIQRGTLPAFVRRRRCPAGASGGGPGNKSVDAEVA